MVYIVDRIEAGVVVLEAQDTGEILEIAKQALPKGIREGQMLRKEGDGFVIDYEGTKLRQEQMKVRVKGLFDRYRG